MAAYGARTRFKARSGGALEGAGPSAALLALEPAALPVSVQAASGLATALRAVPHSTNPEAFVREVDALCRRLAIFAREDDSCPICQGELELWTDGTAFYEQCDLVGCLLNAAGEEVAHRPQGLRPATRAEVLQRFPGAVLVPL